MMFDLLSKDFTCAQLKMNSISAFIWGSAFNMLTCTYCTVIDFKTFNKQTKMTKLFRPHLAFRLSEKSEDHSFLVVEGFIQAMNLIMHATLFLLVYHNALQQILSLIAVFWRDPNQKRRNTSDRAQILWIFTS